MPRTTALPTRVLPPTAALCAAVAVLACSDYAGSSGAREPPEFAIASSSGDEETIVVAFRDSVGPSDRALLSSLTSRPFVYTFRGIPAITIRARSAALASLRVHPRVLFAQTPAPMYATEEVTGWHFQNVPSGHGILRIQNDTAYGYARWGAGIGVAVIGTRVNCNINDYSWGIPHWSGNSLGCAGGADFTGEGTPFTDVYGLATYPYVLRGHETKVASLILAAAANDAQIRGIGPQVTLYSLRIFDSSDHMDCARSASAIDFATYDLSTIVSVINASYGRFADDDADKTYYEEHCYTEKWAVANAVNAGLFIAASAGNLARNFCSTCGDSVYYPARLPGVAAVSGLTSGPTFWSGSSRGSQVTFAASATNMAVVHPGNYVEYVQGTSFAAPVVAGIVAAIQSRYNLPRTGQCMLTHLRATAYTRSGWSSEFYGAGMVDGYRAWSTPLANDPSCVPGPQ